MYFFYPLKIEEKWHFSVIRSIGVGIPLDRTEPISSLFFSNFSYLKIGTDRFLKILKADNSVRLVRSQSRL